MINKRYWNLLFIFVFFCSCREANSQSLPKWKITDLEEYIAKSDTPVIVNFWATYCVPCIKEISYFQEVVKQYEKQGVKLLLVSLDFRESFPDKINSFADKRKFTAPIVACSLLRLYKNIVHAAMATIANTIPIKLP